MKLPSHLFQKLEERRGQNAYRQLHLPIQHGIDFSSNDYLGIVRNHNLVIPDRAAYSSGSTGSRLLTGNNILFEITEAQIAVFHNAEAALLFNSGYDANIGILSSVPQKNDTIIYDSLCHASIRDGIRLSFAKAYSFLHNDVTDLKKKIALGSGNVFIVTESVFSMDGDICPLQDILQICNENNAYLILDEAHAIGVIGKEGKGLAQSLRLHQQVFCRIYTFGKACGCHGAVAVGSKELKNYLINFSRSFMYSTALSQHSVALISQSYRVFPSLQKEREQLHLLINQFQNTSLSLSNIDSSTPIQAVILEGNDKVKQASIKLASNSIDVRPILYPTVAKGKERLRVILHSFNTTNEVEQLISVLEQQ